MACTTKNEVIKELRDTVGLTPGKELQAVSTILDIIAKVEVPSMVPTTLSKGEIFTDEYTSKKGRNTVVTSNLIPADELNTAFDFAAKTADGALTEQDKEDYLQYVQTIFPNSVHRHIVYHDTYRHLNDVEEKLKILFNNTSNVSYTIGYIVTEQGNKKFAVDGGYKELKPGFHKIISKLNQNDKAEFLKNKEYFGLIAEFSDGTIGVANEDILEGKLSPWYKREDFNYSFLGKGDGQLISGEGMYFYRYPGLSSHKQYRRGAPYTAAAIVNTYKPFNRYNENKESKLYKTAEANRYQAETNKKNTPNKDLERLFGIDSRIASPVHEGSMEETVVWDNSRIHILGSDKDIEMFKEWKSKQVSSKPKEDIIPEDKAIADMTPSELVEAALKCAKG